MTTSGHPGHRHRRSSCRIPLMIKDAPNKRMFVSRTGRRWFGQDVRGVLMGHVFLVRGAIRRVHEDLEEVIIRFALRDHDLAIQAGLPGVKYLFVRPSLDVPVTRPSGETSQRMSGSTRTDETGNRVCISPRVPYSRSIVFTRLVYLASDRRIAWADWLY